MSTRIVSAGAPHVAKRGKSAKELKLAKARRGLTDTWYLGSVILKLGVEEGVQRPRREVEPLYQFVGSERPAYYTPEAKRFQNLSVPRFLAKTYIALVRVTQMILRWPNIRIAYHCNEKDQAEECVMLVRTWLELPEIVELYGNHKSKQWSRQGLTSSFRTVPHRDPTLRPLGLDKPLEGKRCHFFVWDDLLGDNNYNPEGVIKVENRYSACMPLIMPGGGGLNLMTRWGMSDTMSDGKTFGGNDGILKKWRTNEPGSPGYWESFGHRGFVSVYGVPGDEDLFPYILEPGHPTTSEGKPLLFPSVWSEAAIEEARGTMVPRLFASQVLNDPLPAESAVYRESDFQHFKLHDENDPSRLNPILGGCYYVMGVDPASGDDRIRRGDRSTICVMGIKWFRDTEGAQLVNGYTVAWVGGQWRTERFVDTFFDLVRQWKPRRIFPEVNKGGKWFTDTITKRGRELGYPSLPITEVKQSSAGGSKEDRLEVLAAAYAYRQIFHAEHLRHGDGEQEALRYSFDGAEHDDFLDSEAIAWQHGTQRRWGKVGGKQNSWRRGSSWGPPRYKKIGL